MYLSYRLWNLGGEANSKYTTTRQIKKCMICICGFLTQKKKGSCLMKWHGFHFKIIRKVIKLKTFHSSQIVYILESKITILFRYTTSLTTAFQGKVNALINEHKDCKTQSNFGREISRHKIKELQSELFSSSYYCLYCITF